MAVYYGYNAEPTAEGVASRIDDRVLMAPSLLAYEVGSVCLKRVGKEPERREEIRAFHRLFSRMDVHSVDVPLEEVLDLAERTGLTAYDAAYLWLAQTLDCELVTLNQKLADAARSVGRPSLDLDGDAPGRRL